MQEVKINQKSHPSQLYPSFFYFYFILKSFFKSLFDFTTVPKSFVAVGLNRVTSFLVEF